jgi:hypothetical protein
MNLAKTGVFLAAVAGGWVSGRAQPVAVQQLQNNQITRELQVSLPGLVAGTNAPEMYAGENEDVGPQKILRLNRPKTYFDVLFDSQFFYSDNANFDVAPNSVGSTVFVNTVQAEIAPPAIDLGPGRAAAAVGVASQWYNYGNNELAPLDFNAETVFVNGKYTWGKWQFGAGVNLTRLVSQGDYDETYREFMPNLSVQRLFPVNDRMFFAVGDVVDYHLTEVPSVLGSRTDINDRFDNIASVSYTWLITRHLAVQPFYRFQYSYYQHDALATSERNDCLQGLGLTAVYYFTKNISVRAFYNYNRRQTDDAYTPAYHELNGGLGATLDLKF